MCGENFETGVCYSTNGTLTQVAVDICPDSPGGTVGITFTAGYLEGDADILEVYQGPAGSGGTGFPIYAQPQPPNFEELTGRTITAFDADTCLHIYIRSDESTNCASENGAPISFDVNCTEALRGETCDDASPLCSGSPQVFAGTGAAMSVSEAEPGTDLGCISNGQGPRPSWFYLEIARAGDLFLFIDAVPRGSEDFDFALYGPFTDLATATGSCGAGLGSPIDCSFMGGFDSESPEILGAEVGEVYVLLVSKFGEEEADFQLSETSATTGATNCSIVAPGLPLDLLDFRASCRGSHTVDLHWTTAREEDMDRFVVQRSRTGNTAWEEIASIPVRNVIAESNYSFADEAAQPSGFYRLRMEGLDGTITYSDIVPAGCEGGGRT